MPYKYRTSTVKINGKTYPLNKDDEDKAFDGVDKVFDGVDKMFDGVDKAFDGVGKIFDGISSQRRKPKKPIPPSDRYFPPKSKKSTSKRSNTFFRSPLSLIKGFMLGVLLLLFVIFFFYFIAQIETENVSNTSSPIPLEETVKSEELKSL